MARNILEEIIEKRNKDFETLGPLCGCDIPNSRQRAVHPFINKKGVILEVKRASPSKGDIAPNLDSYATAIEYSKAGARAISCLTERNYFKGTLDDLMNVCHAVDDFEKVTGKEGPAVLRKDFLTSVGEVEISYRAGADAILLIARILERDTLLEMLKAAESFGISVLIEIRKQEDLEKVASVMDFVKKDIAVYGVNSRDLKDFTIDRLVPAAMLNGIKKIDSNARVVFESGILSPQSAGFAAAMGFSAILMGEAAAKNPENTIEYTRVFEQTSENSNGRTWVDYASKNLEWRKPLVKICGNTNSEDALFAAKCGADFLGFIMWPGSKRNVEPNKIREIKKTIQSNFPGNSIPKFVGVIVEPESREAAEAYELVKEGILDFIQVHTYNAAIKFLGKPEFVGIPHYCAVNVSNEDDIQKIDELNKLGEPRILIDAQSKTEIGGTGKTVDENLLAKIGEDYKLWIAGGIKTENVEKITANFNPELIDLVSSLESEPGKKDFDKVKNFFNSFEKLYSDRR